MTTDLDRPDRADPASTARLPLLALPLRDEHDVVLSRHRIRQLAEMVGLDAQDQTRVATAVSELARNAFQYAGGGRVEVALEGEPPAPRYLTVRVIDHGPGIPDAESVLSGRAAPTSGTGIGLVGAKRLSDRFRMESRPGAGTTVEVAKALPPRARHLDAADLARIGETLAAQEPGSVLEEVRQQNHDLVAALHELRERQAEVQRLNAELEETNRGVLALYAELDDRAEDLRRISEAKSSFLSHMSHELRAPLSSVLNLSRLLLDRSDGELTSEQERQVSMIKRTTESVIEMVSDLLDLAKIEAGKTTLKPATFTATELMSALRGMFRPLLTRETVALVFDDATAIPPLHTDEGKLSQILRNFISNAIKFTTHGEIRVSAALLDDERVRFDVSDTGIGIAPEDQARIWEQFTQIEGPLHRQVRGTGLGLALTRQLAALLGGEVSLRSVRGEGSTFSVIVPRALASTEAAADPAAWRPGA